MPRSICTPNLICAMAGAVRIAVLLGLTAHVLWPRGVAAQNALEKKIKQPDLGAIATMTHEVKPFGKTKDGQDVKVHTLINLHGLRVKLIDYGATLISVETPDKDGKPAN